MTDRPKHDRALVPVVEERVVVRKCKHADGGVRVRTVVHTTDAVVDEALARETIEIARVRLDRWVEAPVPARQEGDTTILTVIEEVVVVEKRLRAIEEVRITRNTVMRHEPRTVALRREEAIVEPLDAADKT